MPDRKPSPGFSQTTSVAAEALKTNLRDAVNLRPGKASTGGEVQHQFALMRARLVARYRLREVPGRPEELVSISAPQSGVSLGYGCKTIRVRKMIGRTWVDHVDFQIGSGWGGELYAFLDTHFRFSPGEPIRPTVPPIISIHSISSGT